LLLVSALIVVAGVSTLLQPQEQKTVDRSGGQVKSSLRWASNIHGMNPYFRPE
jgi:hypothetical protein